MAADRRFIPWTREEAERAARIAAELWPAEYEERKAKLNPSFVARICRLCTHENRYDLDIRILMGEPPHKVANDVNSRYTSKAVLQHRDLHLLKILADTMPEVRQKNIEAALAQPFPFGAPEVDQLDWCVIQMLALREMNSDTKFQLKAVTEVRNTVLALSRMEKRPALEPPRRTASEAAPDAIAAFSEHEDNLTAAFQKSRVRKGSEEEEDAQVVEVPSYGAPY